MEQLNLNDPDKHRDDNEEILQAWIDQILDGTIDLDDEDDGECLRARQNDFARIQCSEHCQHCHPLVVPLRDRLLLSQTGHALPCDSSPLPSLWIILPQYTLLLSSLPTHRPSVVTK